MLFVCYPRCTTCKKAQKWLDENQVGYTFRDIKEDNPTLAELKDWHARSWRVMDLSSTTNLWTCSFSKSWIISE